MAKELLIEYSVFTPIISINEGVRGTSGNLIVSGLLSTADKPNQNKRIYPFDTLYEQVGNYIENFVKGRGAYGECVDDRTEILTTSGWKFIKDISNNEEIFTLNEQTNKIEKEVIKDKVDREHQEKMYHIHNNSSIDMMLTPNHNMLFYDRYGKPYSLYAQEFVDRFRNNINDIGHSAFKKGDHVWIGNDVDFFEFGDVKVKAEDFMAFLGIWIAEGSYDKKGTGVSVCQVKEDSTKKIKELFDSLPFEYSLTVSRSGKSTFRILNKSLNEYCDKIGVCSDKYIPTEIKDLNPNLLNILLDWMLIGDGRNRKRKKRINEEAPVLHRELYTTSYQLAQDTSEIIMKIGNCATINTREQKDRYIGDRLVKAENSKLLYIISEGKNNKSYIDRRFLKVDEIDYSGRVYCVTTNNGTWLMRRNGCISWTKNCDHPDRSIVELKTASHIITEMWWEGKDLYGKVEILPTPSGNILKALFENKLRVGISSRALGSVTPLGEGVVKVEDDLDLIAWDFVSNPSNMGSYMHTQKSSGLRESVEYNTKSSDKYSRINTIIGDLLCSYSGQCCLR
jgi:hypothetical protein